MSIQITCLQVLNNNPTKGFNHNYSLYQEVLVLTPCMTLGTTQNQKLDIGVNHNFKAKLIYLIVKTHFLSVLLKVKTAFHTPI